MRALLAGSFVAILVAGTLAGCVTPLGESGKDQAPTKLQGTGHASAVFPGQYKFDGSYSQVLADGPYKMLPAVHQFIKSKLDGVDIEIGYWLPDVPAGTKVPVIIHGTPYDRPAGAVTQLSGMKLFLVDNFLPYGYAVASVAVRGTGDSGGCMDLMGKKEIDDLDQAVTWLATQPWSNGNAAMIGVSYDGSTPWSVASRGNEHLKTIVPISGVPDVYGLMFRNGTAETRGPILLNYLYYTYGYAYIDPVGGSDQNRSAQHRIEGVACPEAWEGFEAAMYSGTTGGRDANGWWAERNRKPAVEKNYHGSILSVQGLQDWNVDPSMVLPWVQKLNESGLVVHQMLGQWPHASPDRQISKGKPASYTRYDWAETLLHWFDYWLKDMKTVDLGPTVQVQNQAFQWRTEDTWPPKDAAWRTYHLASGSTLAGTPGAAGSVVLAPTPFLPDPQNNIKAMPGYAADFSTAPMESDALISGLPRLHVTFTPAGEAAQVSAWLYDVPPGGAPTETNRIAWTSMNLWYADGTETMKPLTPGMPLLAKIQFQPMDAVVKSGHRIVLRVWEYGSEPGLVANLPDRVPVVPSQPVQLNFGGTARSVLELPIIQRDASVYFQPPMPTPK